MTELIHKYLTVENVALFVNALIIGIIKSGIPALGVLSPIILTPVFGAKVGVALTLPLYIFGDISAVVKYRFGGDVKKISMLKILIPFALIGVFLGAFFGKDINANIFKKSIGIIILIGLALLIVDKSFKKMSFFEKIKQSNIYKLVFGAMGGFSSMVGNAGGPIMNMFLVSMNLKKEDFIIVVVWFFFTINISKLFIHMLFWHTITFASILKELYLLPSLIIGFFLGILIIKFLSKKLFDYIAIFLSMGSCVYLMFF